MLLNRVASCGSLRGLPGFFSIHTLRWSTCWKLVFLAFGAISIQPCMHALKHWQWITREADGKFAKILYMGIVSGDNSTQCTSGKEGIC